MHKLHHVCVCIWTEIWEILCIYFTVGEAKECGQWLKRGTLVDSRTSVTDVKFAPKHLGLLLVN